MSTLTGSATEPTSSLTVPTVGGDTDTWGTVLNETSLQALLDYILWLRDRVPRSESKVSATAHGFNVGDVLRHNGTTWVAAAADTAGNAVAAGVVTSVPDVDTFVIAHAGLVSGLPGLTGGSVHYLQDAGGLGTTPGTVNVPVLLAVSTTSGVLLSLSSAATGGGSGDMTKAAYDTNDDGTVDSADEAARVVETVATDTDSTATHAFDLSTGTIHELTLTAACTVSFTNVPTGGFGITLILTQDGSGGHTVTWPAAVQWAGGTAPTLTADANAVDIVTLFTPDSGTTWYGFLAGLDFS